LKIPNLTGLNIEKLLPTHVLFHKNGTIGQLYTDPSKPGYFSGISGFLKSNKNIKKKYFLNYLKNTEA
jgi:hypothetical protein